MNQEYMVIMVKFQPNCANCVDLRCDIYCFMSLDWTSAPSSFQLVRVCFVVVLWVAPLVSVTPPSWCTDPQNTHPRPLPPPLPPSCRFLAGRWTSDDSGIPLSLWRLLPRSPHHRLGVVADGGSHGRSCTRMAPLWHIIWARRYTVPVLRHLLWTSMCYRVQVSGLVGFEGWKGREGHAHVHPRVEYQTVRECWKTDVSLCPTFI